MIKAFAAICASFLLSQNALAEEPESRARPAPGTADCAINPSDFCRLPGALSIRTARDRLGSGDTVFWREGSVLHVAARREGGPVRLCCALQETLQDLGDGRHWGASFHIRNIDRAFLDIFVMPDDPSAFTLDKPPVFRGPQALPRPPRVEPLTGRITTTELPADELGGPRSVTVYIPPGEPPAGGWPVVYAGDGQVVNGYGQIAEALADAGRIRPVLLVGIWDGSSTGQEEQAELDLRAREYLWGYAPDRFAKHETFVLETVLPWAERELNASSDPRQRMLYGLSNSAGWAVATALHNPGLFGHVSAASFLWDDAAEAGEPDPSTRYTFGAGEFGTFERGALHSSTELVARLSEAGVEADLTQFATGHSPLGFEQQFARGLLSAFPAESAD